MTIDVTTITVQQFQTQFARYFPFFDSIQWSSTPIYNTGDEVYYPGTNLFYQSLVDGNQNVVPGSDATKWAKYADNLDNWVQDGDITNAFAEAQMVFNTAFFANDAQTTLAYLYLTAHYLCNDLKTAMAGIYGGPYFPMSGRTVGSVSEQYFIPDAYKNDPILSQYTQTAYGMKYLSFIQPQLIGNMVAVFGGSQP